MVTFLITYDIICLVYIVKRIAIICVWKHQTKSDPHKTEACMVLWSIVFLNTFEVILQIYAQFFFWLLLTEAIEDKYNTSNLNRISALMTLPIIIYGYVVMVIYFLLIIGSLAVLIGGSKSGYLNFNKGLVDEYNKALASREINR